MIRYKGHKDLKNKLLKDMVLVCFNVSVYLMDITTKKMEGSMSNETIMSSSIDEKSCNLVNSVERKDTSLFEEVSMVNPTNTYEPNEDTKMMESSVDEKIIEKDTIDLVSPSTKVFPDVLFDSESTKETEAKLSADTEPTTSVNDVNKDIFSVQDAFAFCPMGDTIVLKEVLQQGIFAQEMDQLVETKDSIFNKFVTIPFGNEDASRSMKQAIEEYLKDVKINAKEYSSALNVLGIFSYAEDCPIENWLCNSVESLKGNAIELPTNWFDISELTNIKDWPLFYSLSMKRIEHERMYIPVEAFRFWEQKDFKELLTEVMDKSAFFKINPEEEKDQGIAYLFLEMFNPHGYSESGPAGPAYASFSEISIKFALEMIQRS